MGPLISGKSSLGNYCNLARCRILEKQMREIALKITWAVEDTLWLFLLCLVERLVYSKWFLLQRFIGHHRTGFSDFSGYFDFRMVAEMAVDHFTLKCFFVYPDDFSMAWIFYQMCALPKLVPKKKWAPHIHLKADHPDLVPQVDEFSEGV